jgi:hypothetical protein
MLNDFPDKLDSMPDGMNIVVREGMRQKRLLGYSNNII